MTEGATGRSEAGHDQADEQGRLPPENVTDPSSNHGSEEEAGHVNTAHESDL